MKAERVCWKGYTAPQRQTRFVPADPSIPGNQWVIIVVGGGKPCRIQNLAASRHNSKTCQF
jgi:hypothetical protein